MFLYLEKYRRSVVDNASPLRHHCDTTVKVRCDGSGVGGGVGGGVVGASVGGFVGNSIRTMRLDTIRVHTH